MGIRLVGCGRGRVGFEPCHGLVRQWRAAERREPPVDLVHALRRAAGPVQARQARVRRDGSLLRGAAGPDQLRVGVQVEQVGSVGTLFDLAAGGGVAGEDGQCGRVRPLGRVGPVREVQTVPGERVGLPAPGRRFVQVAPCGASRQLDQHLHAGQARAVAGQHAGAVEQPEVQHVHRGLFLWRGRAPIDGEGGERGGRARMAGQVLPTLPAVHVKHRLSHHRRLSA